MAVLIFKQMHKEINTSQLLFDMERELMTKLSMQLEVQVWL
ncbi:hypothetical protein SP41_63 [Salmonella phage 41]|nr:hypothetical protein SP41_63 [Salmonella phage 41]